MTSRRNKSKGQDGSATGPELVPVKFSRLTRRGIPLGLSAAQLVTVGIAIATIITPLYAWAGCGWPTPPPSGPPQPSSPGSPSPDAQ